MIYKKPQISINLEWTYQIQSYLKIRIKYKWLLHCVLIKWYSKSFYLSYIAWLYVLPSFDISSSAGYQLALSCTLRRNARRLPMWSVKNIITGKFFKISVWLFIFFFVGHILDLLLTNHCYLLIILWIQTTVHQYNRSYWKDMVNDNNYYYQYFGLLTRYNLK